MYIVKGVWNFSNVSYYSPVFVYEEVTGTTTFLEANYSKPNAAFTAIALYDSTGGNMARFDGPGLSNGLAVRPAIMEGQTIDFGKTEQTVSDNFYTWLTANAVQQSSGPSEPETDILYTVYGSSLTAVANAIRGKTGTTDELAFPDGFVSTVNDISSVSDLSNAKDIAFGGNESGGKYVIEDETITPLFDQIQRITETEDAMTFEDAEQALLNVVPGGGLPTAETGAFGTDGALAYGLPNVTGFKNRYGGWRTSGLQFVPTEDFAIVGYRYYIASSITIGSGIKLWDSNGNLLATSAVPSYNVTGQWQTIMLDTPVNVAIGAKYTVGIYTNGWTYATMGTPNAKIRDVKGCYYSGNGIPTSTTSDAMGVVDIIIGAISAELPDSYEIQRTTMDDIAVEVQRITGTESKMSTAEIITALKGM